MAFGRTRLPAARLKEALSEVSANRRVGSGRGSNKNRPVKKRGALVFRFFSRLAIAVTLVVLAPRVQFARIVNENVAMAHSLFSVQKDTSRCGTASAVKSGRSAA